MVGTSNVAVMGCNETDNVRPGNTAALDSSAAKTAGAFYGR